MFHHGSLDVFEGRSRIRVENGRRRFVKEHHSIELLRHRSGNTLDLGCFRISLVGA